jgi:hypothetical protein
VNVSVKCRCGHVESNHARRPFPSGNSKGKYTACLNLECKCLKFEPKLVQSVNEMKADFRPSDAQKDA